MRLIDADKIIKWADDSVSQYGGTYTNDMLNMFGLFKHIIDNAPTIKTFTLLDIEEQYRKGLKKGLSEWKTERPQGEWEYNQYDGNARIGNWHCSICHNICYEMKLAHDNYNFCPKCGADMRGDKE